MSPRSTDATDVIVGRNIRVHRLARRMSQTDLAAQLGITFQQLQKYEIGMNRVGSGRLARIAQAFDLPIAALYQGTAVNRKRKHADSMLHLLTRREPIRLVQAFANIKDPSLRRAIVRLVESLAVSKS